MNKAEKAVRRHEKMYHEPVIKSSIHLTLEEADQIVDAVFNYFFKPSNQIFIEDHRRRLRDHIIEYMNELR